MDEMGRRQKELCLLPQIPKQKQALGPEKIRSVYLLMLEKSKLWGAVRKELLSIHVYLGNRADKGSGIFSCFIPQHNILRVGIVAYNLPRSHDAHNCKNVTSNRFESGLHNSS
jgi:hypothetical protein